MGSVSILDFIRCPDCKAMVWEDLHALKRGVKIRFRCIRCGHVISLGTCSQCHTKAWSRLSDFVEKEGKKPVVRFECKNCRRIIGILLD
jgi:hypothetical protein